MALRTDLALEEFINAIDKSGVESAEYQSGNIKINKIKISTDEAAKRLKKPVANYVTLEVGDIQNGLCETHNAAETIAKEISLLLPSFSSVLVVGLGNLYLTADALGPLCTKGLLATRHLDKAFLKNVGITELREVSVLSPGVLGQTGIEACETVLAVCDKIKPSAVLVIDALAASDVNRLGTTVQINDFGICPGSGVGNSRKEISKATLSRPVIALGVPTVAATENDSLIITSRQIDLLTQRAAELLSHAINFALQPKIEREILLSLV